MAHRPPERGGGSTLAARSLALDEESAWLKRTALSELNRFHQEVVQATTAVEVEVLGVVTTDDLSGLGVLEHAWHDAETALRELMATTHVIDADYMSSIALLARQTTGEG